jgi:hypothetical protein
MYHAPWGERTDAWNPSGVRSARIVAVASSIPLPAYVLISGCLAASPASITGESASSNRWKSPAGVGNETTSGAAARCCVARSFGALANTDFIAARSRV